MSGLPKKYAKMGFKKGWKAYKASKRKKPKTRIPRKKTRRKKGRTMAKKTKRRASSKTPKINKKGAILFLANNVLTGELDRARGWIKGSGPLKGMSLYSDWMKRNNQLNTWINTILIWKYGDCNVLKQFDKKLSINKKSAAITYKCAIENNYAYWGTRIKAYAKNNNPAYLKEIGTGAKNNMLWTGAQAYGVWRFGAPIKYKGRLL